MKPNAPPKVDAHTTAGAPLTAVVSFSDYLSRWEFIAGRCRGKRVIHLGCIGMTDEPMDEKVRAMHEGRVIHMHLRATAAELIGIDYDAPTVDALRKEGFTEIHFGDVEQLEVLDFREPFDVVVCGDLIEHLGKPGRMLEGLHPVMSPSSELLITTPNTFGLPNYIRYSLGRFHEGKEHVGGFNLTTLGALLERYGYRITEAYTCYDHPPTGLGDRLKYSVGSAFFRRFPKFGGTLAVVGIRSGSSSGSRSRP